MGTGIQALGGSFLCPRHRRIVRGCFQEKNAALKKSNSTNPAHRNFLGRRCFMNRWWPVTLLLKNEFNRLEEHNSPTAGGDHDMASAGQRTATCPVLAVHLIRAYFPLLLVRRTLRSNGRNVKSG